MKYSIISVFLFLACVSSLYAGKLPNIMVFLIDDMGVMDTSVPFLTDEKGKPKKYPLNHYYRTPGMERLAKQGIRFNQFYAMSVCSPTRISIMTGQNAARHRATNWINPWGNNRGSNGPNQWDWVGLEKGDVTLPGVLRTKGYKTIHVGKAHFGPEEHDGAEPLNLGFDINVGGASFGAPGSYFAEKNYGKGTRRARSAVPHLDKYHGSDTFLSEALTIEAKKQISEIVKKEQPFFLHFSHYAVHAPFESDPRFAANYEKSDKPKSAKAFATLIEGMDKSLNDMLNHFDKLGVAEDTLVIFLGDNGSDAPLGHQHAVACSAPLRGKKGAHYEGGMRVPFIAAWAKPNAKNVHQKRLEIPANKILPQVANVTDLFPTLLQLTDTKSPKGHKVDGKSLLLPLTGSRDHLPHQQFLMHYPHGPHRSNYFTVWRDGDWKVIYHNFPKNPPLGGKVQSAGERYELFNLAKDPFESTNVAKDNPEVLKKMMQGLVAQLKQHDAVYPQDKEGKAMKPIVP